MGEMTIVKQAVAQRDKELRAQRKPGPWDWMELPCGCVLGWCLMLVGIMVALAALVLVPFCPPHQRRITRHVRNNAATVSR